MTSSPTLRLLLIATLLSLLSPGFAQIDFDNNKVYTERFKAGTFFKEKAQNLDYWKGIRSIWNLYPSGFDHSTLILNSWKITFSLSGKALVMNGKDENLPVEMSKTLSVVKSIHASIELNLTDSEGNSFVLTEGLKLRRQ